MKDAIQNDATAFGMEVKDQIGNQGLLELPKKAFLCSRKVSASAVLKSYDWAIKQREEEICVISGFHSQIEKDVLHYLLKGIQPIIVVLARGLKKKIEPEFEERLAKGNLLIITPFDSTVKRVTERTATIRNQLMLHLANTITVGHVSKGGKLDQLLENASKPVYKIT